MKYTLILVLVFGLFGCGNEAQEADIFKSEIVETEIVGNFYDSKNRLVLKFSPDKKVIFMDEGYSKKAISYQRKKNVIEVRHPDLFGPVEIVIQDANSLNFMRDDLVKK